MEAQRARELEVFTEFFTDLVTSIQNSTLPIANECLSKKLIMPSIQKKILDMQSREGQATELLNAVCDCLGHQRNSFNKFLKVLKNQLIFDDLIGRLKEALDRKHTAECTDKRNEVGKPSLVLTKLPEKDALVSAFHDSSVRKKVVKSHLPEMKSCTRCVINAVATRSESKQLISRTTYLQVIRPNQSLKQRTNCLLLSVCKCVRGDAKKFKVFLEILNFHPICKEVVQKVRDDIRKSLAEVVASPTCQLTAEHKKRTQPTHPSSSICKEETDKPTANESGGDERSNMVFSSGETSDVKVRVPKVSSRIESEYFLRMDKQQAEALLLDSNKQKIESDRLSHEISKLEKDKLEKDLELQGKEKKLRNLGEEKDNLQLAVDSMKVKVSLVEREMAKQVSTVVLQKRVTELEEEIAGLNKEKNVLQKQLSRLSTKLEVMQMSLDENKTVLEATQTTLKDTRVTLKVTTQFCKTRDKYLKYILILILILIFLFFVLFFVLFMMKLW